MSVSSDFQPVLWNENGKPRLVEQFNVSGITSAKICGTSLCNLPDAINSDQAMTITFTTWPWPQTTWFQTRVHFTTLPGNTTTTSTEKAWNGLTWPPTTRQDWIFKTLKSSNKTFQPLQGHAGRSYGMHPMFFLIFTSLNF